MHILDTDIASLLYYGTNEKILAKYRRFPADQLLVLSSITQAQLLTGRSASVLKAATGDEWLIAEKRLQDTFEWISRFVVVRVDPAAAKLFDVLRQQKKINKIGRADLLTAYVCLALDATLVTRNTKDFILVPNLKLENWAE
jgi:tRNA(fMet)-specific endonuclease VapC